MSIQCMIVDDEPLAIKLIEKHIAQIDSLEVTATCNNAIKAFEILNTTKIDLLFLDIKMPMMTGVDFLKNLKNPPKTIFTTAYRDYAIESYELDVIDYLLKPITFERFFRGIQRFLREHSSLETPIEIPIKENQENNVIYIKSGNKYHKIKIESILYIESIKDYIKIHTEDGQRIVSKYKISNIQKELNHYSFLRVHRSYIINTKKITAFTTHDIEVQGVEIPIGVSYKKEVMDFLPIK